MAKSPASAQRSIPSRHRPARTRPLGPFSYLLMCVLHRLPKRQRYGAILEQELSNHYRELIDLAQVYVALQRLVEKKLLESEMSKPITGTNHNVVVYTLTPAGRKELEQAARFYRMLADAGPN